MFRVTLKAFPPAAVAAIARAPFHPSASFRMLASPTFLAAHVPPSASLAAACARALPAAAIPPVACSPGAAVARLSRSMGTGIKTHAGTKKRFKVTASGKVIRPSAGKKHNTGKHPRAKIRARGLTQTMNGTKHEQQIRSLLALSSMIR